MPRNDSLFYFFNEKCGLVPRRLPEAAPRRLRSIISVEIECCCREWPLRVTKGTKVAENLCSLDCKPITPSRGNPLCVRRERSVAARAHVFLTLPAKLLVMVADPQSSLSGRIPLDDDRNRLLAARLYHCVLLSAKLALSGCAVI